MLVRDWQNDLILPVNQGGFFGTRYDEGRVYTGDISLRKEMVKHINSNININHITCVCETCISTMFLQSYLNKQQLRLLARI